MHAIVFDVDGTLIDSSSVDSELYVTAIRRVLGPVRIREKWSSYKNVTDSGILEEIISDNNVRNGALIIEQIRRVFVESVERYISQNGPFKEVPGAKEFITSLCTTEDYLCAYATGGWGASARLKLESSGFCVAGVPFSSSDDASDRRAIMLEALGKLGESFKSVTYYGDGPWDQEAAKYLGWGFVAVGRKLNGIEHYARISPNKAFKFAPSAPDAAALRRLT